MELPIAPSTSVTNHNQRSSSTDELQALVQRAQTAHILRNLCENPMQMP